MSSGHVVRARIGAPHGVKGMVRVRLETDYPERLRSAEAWSLRLPAGEVREYRLEQTALYRDGLLAKLAGIDDRDAAQALRGAEVVIAEADLPPLPDDEYYWHQLIGLRVETVDGESVGQIREIIRTGSNDVYVTEGPLIPAIREVVEKVDLEAGVMVIRPMPGLLD